MRGYLKVAGLTVGGAASFSSDLVGDDDKVGGAGTGADAAGGVLNTPPPLPGDPNNTELLKNKKNINKGNINLKALLRTGQKKQNWKLRGIFTKNLL